MSKNTGPNVNEIIDSMCELFEDRAEDEAKVINQNAEARAEESYRKNIDDLSAKLEEEHRRNMNQIETDLKINEAKIQNNVKLEVLKSQTEALHEALKEAIDQLNQISEGPGYKKLLRDLIAEGFDRLKESKVHLMVRKKDLQLAQDVLDEAIKIAEDANPGLKIQAKIDNTRFLPQPPQCAGGVVFLCQKGRIRVSNVLNDRLRLAYEGLLPRIRKIVLGDEGKYEMPDDDDEDDTEKASETKSEKKSKRKPSSKEKKSRKSSKKSKDKDDTETSE